MLRSLRKKYAALTVGLLMAIVPVMVPAAAMAAGTNISDCLSEGSNLGISNGSNCTKVPTTTGTTKVNDLITAAVNIFSAIVGVISVIMIIFGGFQYITSGGDSGKITNAKNTIIYAVIGLVIVGMAQFIVQFVLNKVAPSGA